MTVNPWVPEPVTVTSVAQETRDTITLSLDTAHAPRRFRPGQFHMLTVFGHGDVPISISGPPSAPWAQVHTIRAVGAVTRPLCALSVGATVGLRGPFGTSWPLVEARGDDVVLLAGGIGLAPLRPVIYHLLEHRQDYGNIAILVGARSPDDLLFTRELKAWRGRFDLQVRVTVDSGGADWRGSVGVVTRLVARARFDPDDTVVMTCGPEVMMHFAVREMRQHGVSEERMWVSMERNMKCGVGLCGHCQWGPHLVCRDGPVYRWPDIAPLLGVRSL